MRAIYVLLLMLVISIGLTSAQSLLSKSVSFPSSGTVFYSSYPPGRIGSRVWVADFETGDLSQFDSTQIHEGNVLEVTSTERHGGNYGLRVHKEEGVNTAKGIFEPSSPLYDFHFKFAVKWNFSESGWTRLLEIRTQEEETLVIQMSPKQISFEYKGGLGKSPIFNIKDGLWHVFDIYASFRQNGALFIYLDGKPLFEKNGGLEFTDSSGNPYSFGLLWIGIVYTDGARGHGDIYYDDIEVDLWMPPKASPQPPYPFFIYYPTTPKPGEEVTFYAYHSYDLDGNIVSYLWHFGDGGASMGQNVTHRFSSEGLYNITLTVTDNSWLSASLSSQISVETRRNVSAVRWALPLRTEGKKIVDSLGNDVTLLLTGVAKMGINYANPAKVTWREVDPAYYESDARLMASWGIRFHRVPINWYHYMTDYRYREIIKQLVDIYTSNGMLVLMDVHSYNFRGYSGGGTFPQAKDLTKEFAWVVANDAILCLKGVAHDFLYNPMVIGVEINEFRPRFPEDYMYNYLFKFELAAKLADEVHAVNPNLLVLMEFGQDGWNSRLHDFDSIRPQCKALIENRNNIVYAPHIYFAERFGRSYIWKMYLNGDLEGGKREMYTVLDAYYLYEQNYYNVPVIVSEWASQGRTPQVILDEMDYFIEHNWGSAYWAWFRSNTYDEHLLEVDWVTPSATGNAFKEKLVLIKG